MVIGTFITWAPLMATILLLVYIGARITRGMRACPPCRHIAAECLIMIGLLLVKFVWRRQRYVSYCNKRMSNLLGYVMRQGMGFLIPKQLK